MCLPGNIHLCIRADTQVRPYNVIIETFVASVSLCLNIHIHILFKKTFVASVSLCLNHHIIVI